MKPYLALLAVLLLSAVFVLETGDTASALSPVACTEEAKICPDGSGVGRTGPNCEFAPCPGEGANPPAGNECPLTVVKPCPDGSHVAPQGPNCEFPACPTKEAPPKSTEAPVLEKIARCTHSSECIVVPYKHCCGATKTAINKKNLKTYNAHPEWQSFDGPVCAMIGQCAPDNNVTETACEEGLCQLIFP